MLILGNFTGAKRSWGVGEREHQGNDHTPVDGLVPRYEQRTEDVIVRVAPEFLAEQSNPSDSRFIWAYTVEIDNQSDKDLTVTDRFWQIADSSGQVQEVRAAGVVGETPMVKSGETFRYTSGAPLTAPSGMMRGAYTMRTESGESFDIIVPTFLLDSPHEGHCLN
ncbi:MAG: Co2+/Mg2+ efflux protein ApaG [Litorimonas sp.]